MSLNVIKTYLKFNRKRLINYGKIILEKYYNKNIFESLLDTYIDERFFQGAITIKVINKKLVNKASLLSKEEVIDDIKLILKVFPYIYYLDGFLNKDIDVIIDKINQYRVNELKLEDLDNDFKNIFNSDIKRIDKYLNSFNSKDYNLDIKNTNLKKYKVTLLFYNIKIPKLYSDYAINNVYNKGLVLENRLFIIYYMVSILILNDLLNKESNYYEVLFSKSLFEKEEKLTRLFNIIDNDLVKDKIVLRVIEEDFLEYKDNYLKLINDGYKFVLYLNDNSKLKDDAICRVFSYIYCDNEVMEVK